jgi:predicted anti-sigma-YlaC factor YlaD
MEFEFDKEIDAILRKTRDGESVFAIENPPFAHFDADELSAFAENALPEKTKIFYIEHLADCNRCRQILSNIILLNSEAETSPAFVADEQKIIAPVLPWYRRFFAFPNLAFSLGALVLVFGGLLGFIVLQTSYQSEVSQTSNRVSDTKSQPVMSANTTNTVSYTHLTLPTKA